VDIHGEFPLFYEYQRANPHINLTRKSPVCPQNGGLSLYIHGRRCMSLLRTYRALTCQIDMWVGSFVFAKESSKIHIQGFFANVNCSFKGGGCK